MTIMPAEAQLAALPREVLQPVQVLQVLPEPGQRVQPASRQASSTRLRRYSVSSPSGVHS